MKIKSLEPEFVEFIPSPIQEGVLYVSMQYGTAVHLCCCGCGNKVITPFTPTDWKLTFDGVSVSLSPSIGNWNFKCQSHYWIKRNKIEWSGQMSQKEIEKIRKIDKSSKKAYFLKDESISTEVNQIPISKKPSIWEAVLKLFGM